MKIGMSAFVLLALPSDPARGHGALRVLPERGRTGVLWRSGRLGVSVG